MLSLWQSSRFVITSSRVLFLIQAALIEICIAVAQVGGSGTFLGAPCFFCHCRQIKPLLVERFECQRELDFLDIFFQIRSLAWGFVSYAASFVTSFVSVYS